MEVGNAQEVIARGRGLYGRARRSQCRSRFCCEVKGPPGGGTDFTAARTQANSICAFSGLNDFIEGHESFLVQSYGVDVAGTGELPFGQLGQDCRGFSNPYNPPGS
jgi:hypothetical protein